MNLNARNKIRRLIQGVLPLLLVAFTLTGCGGGSGTDNKKVDLPTCRDPQVVLDNGTCGDPRPPYELPACPEGQVRDGENCIVPDFPAPERKPGPNEVVIYVNVEGTDDERFSAFAGYNLHLWQDCGGGWGSSATDSTGKTYTIPTTWPFGPGISSKNTGAAGERHDPYYGAFFVIPTSELGTCGNFIIKTPGGAAQTDNMQISIKRGGGDFDRMAWVVVNTSNMRNSRLSDIPVCLTEKCTLERPLVSISDVEAHWISPRTILWNREFAANKKVELYRSTAGGISAAQDGNLQGGQLLATLNPGRVMTEEEQALVPYLDNYLAYDLPANVAIDTIKSALKDELIILGRYDSVEKNDKDETVTIERGRATRIQLPHVLDALYTASVNADADEAKLGVNYSDGVGVSVWAPTAQNVELRIYSGEPLRVADTKTMQWDANTGIWSYKGSAAELDRKYYRFRVTAYNPLAKKVQRLEVTDPYSVSLSTNSRHSQFVNLNDADLKPAGWDNHAVPTVVAPEAATIYEGHVRDFSVSDQSTPTAFRGKYLAFAQTNTAPVEHLRKLVASGLTHIHLLPSNDISSINEDATAQVNLDSYIFELCQKVADKASVEACDGSVSNGATIRSVLQGFDPQSAKARSLAAAMADLDGFNWGYDPQHFNAPEGSYATNPQGAVRVKEMREMNMALHQLGLRVVMDVVYPHTVSSGFEAANSVFDKVVPGYYYRTNPATAEPERGTAAGPDTATEHRMMGKFVADSVVQWAQQYKVDGFRFDQSGFMPKSVLVDAYEAVQAVDADNYFYAEAWTPAGGTSGDRIVERAVQDALAGTGIGTFNDRIRNPLQRLALIRGENVDAVRAGLAGNLRNFKLKTRSGAVVNAETVGAYNLDPQEAVNYVDKHDNETLWDWIHRPDAVPASLGIAERVRISSLTSSIPLLSQGVPFIHMGNDLLRSKSMSPNSYNAGDWFNAVDFTKQSNNWAVGLPPELRDGVTNPYVQSLFANPNTKPTANHIAQASSVFDEFLSIASGSPLFSLQTADEVLDRVGFHDGGKSQVAGLIVYSIDDGVGTVGDSGVARADLDTAVDAIIVVINGTASTQTPTVKTASGFALHSIQKNSADSVVRTASFAAADGGGTFSVPAYTTAVFVKAQAGVQGEGLSATASIGSSTVVPYGDTAIYVRGDVSAAGWDATAANRMTYDGEGIYSVLLNVPAGTHNFKVAEANWSSPNLGSNQPISIGGSITLTQGSNDNIAITVPTAGQYRFELDASSSTTAPTLRVVDPETWKATPVYLRGTVTASGWDANTGNQLTYEGNSVYAISVALNAQAYEFKVASSDWTAVNLGAAQAVVLGENITLQNNGSNIAFTVDTAATYRFVVDARNPDAPVIKVYREDVFAATPIYLRGELTSADWGATNATNQLVYQGKGIYAITLSLTARTYQFKVAEANWTNPNLGGAALVLGEAGDLVQGSNDNLSITIPSAGNYRFTVDTTSPNAVTLTVTAVGN